MFRGNLRGNQGSAVRFNGNDMGIWMGLVFWDDNSLSNPEPGVSKV